MAAAPVAYIYSLGALVSDLLKAHHPAWSATDADVASKELIMNYFPAARDDIIKALQKG